MVSLHALAYSLHQLTVLVDDFLVLRHVLALEGVEGLEECLPARTGCGDHPAHPPRGERHVWDAPLFFFFYAPSAAPVFPLSLPTFFCLARDAS